MIQQQTLSTPDGAAMAPYITLGATQGFDPIPLNRYIMLLMGRPGTGKTALAMSIPRCLLLDWEGGARQARRQQAMRIPSRGTLTVDSLRAVMAHLEKDHASPKRPFDFVAVDTVDKWFWVEVKEATRIFREENPGTKITSILDIDTDFGKGRSQVYRRIIDSILALKAWGYGVMLITHQVEHRKKIPRVGEVINWAPSLPTGLLGPLAAESEIVGTVERRIKVEKEKTIVAYKHPKTGEPMTRPGKSKETTSIKHFLTMETTDVYQDSKYRLRFGCTDIELPESNPWGAIKDVYDSTIANIASEQGEPARA